MHSDQVADARPSGEIEAGHSTAELRKKLAESEDARARADRLHLLTAALSKATASEDVAQAVIDGVQRLFDGVAGVVMAGCSRDGSFLELLRARDMPAEVFEQWRRIPLIG